ncbi:MAG: hypothetical protein J1F24_06460 [Oscillospiraceae bacterium]|nr:hypothetical protein [Oscillospiraceae bacterium]
MRVLFISASPIIQEISVGNTFLNVFEDMENIEFASIYTRAGTPDPKISQGFCITEKMIINGILKKSPVGKRVSCDQNKNTENRSDKKEQGIINFMKKRRWTVFFWLQNLIWKTGKWKLAELRNFVEEYDPDVIFTLLSNLSFLNNLILYVLSVTNVKLMLYAWDNNYSLKQFYLSPLRWINLFIDRAAMRKVAKKAEKFYVISDIQKDEYEKCFKTNCKILTKFADFTAPAPEWAAPEGKIKMLYTGNLGVDRWKSLELISDAIEKLNDEGNDIELNIYSATPLTKKMKNALSKNGSKIHPPVSYETVQTLQREADILVHIEGLSLQSRLTVHQSFSTKLVDYFHMGKCIFAVGKDDEASIKHLIDNGAAVVAKSAPEVYENLKALCENREQIVDYGKKAYECGAKHHDKTTMQTMLADDLKAICENKG